MHISLLKSLTFLSLVAIFSLSSCSIWQERHSNEYIEEYYQSRDTEVSISYYKVRGRKMRYMSVGSDSLPTVLLIHGSPSSMSVFNQLILESDLLDRAKVYAVDRPGYGYSEFGKTVTSIKRQAAMIAPILDSINKSSGPVVVLGVSYGGPVAARLAMDYPDLVDGLVLGAPAIAPGEEKIYTISHLMVARLTKHLFPTILRVASEEKFSHEDELIKMLPYWEQLDKPIIYVQGEEDDLIYTSNASFIEEYASNVPFLKVVMIPNQPHFLAIPQKDLLAESIVEMLDLLEDNSVLSSYTDEDVLDLTSDR